MYDYSNRPLATARWIAPGRESASPVIRREFLIGSGEDTSRAKLYITGLGFFEAYLNGRRLGDEYFQPLPNRLRAAQLRRHNLSLPRPLHT